MFKTIIYVVFLSAFAAIAQCQNSVKDSSRFEKGRAYSDSILQNLQKDINYYRTTEDLVYPIDWNETLFYVKDRLADKDFSKLYSCKISKWLPGDYFIDIKWHPIKYEPSKFPWLPVYVFLPNNGLKKATIVSFREMTEQAFVELPDELSDYYRIFESDNNSEPWYMEKKIRFTGDSLKIFFPKISKMEFHLVSKSVTKKTKISALEFSTYEFGPNEITAEFQDSISDVVFAFPVNSDIPLPRFIEFDSTKFGHLLDDPENTTVISTPALDMVYISSTCPVPISIDMLWDYRNRVIRQLQASFGVSLGNENPCYKIKHLLKIEDEYFVLRIDDRIAELIFLKPNDFRIVTIADETAPEL